MSHAIAKKYVNALMQACTLEELHAMEPVFHALAAALSHPKCKAIIASPNIDAAGKRAFILSLVENPSRQLSNFIALLADNDRLLNLPAIAQELAYKRSLSNNTFRGEVLSQFELTQEELAGLEHNFSQKFQANITLVPSSERYPGLKIALDDLGIEVSFSLDRLRAQMSEHILKAL